MRISDWSSDVCSSDLIGYTLRAPLFSDYTDKHRFVAIPAGKKAKVAADGTIEFPVGTVLVKSFGWADVNGGRPVETRLLIHRASGWTALPYIWDADGKDATLALGGRRVPVSFKDRKSVGSVKSVSVRVALGGSRIIKKKKNN